MGTACHTECICRFGAASYKDYQDESSVWKSQFEEWKSCASAVLTESLEKVVVKRTGWLEDGF